MNIKPLPGIVLVKIKVDNFIKTESGIILKKNNGAVNDRNTSGDVVEVSEESILKINDTVYFDKVSGIDYESNGENYLFLKESSIIGYTRN